ncbi:MAG: hypothetical protein H6Q15_1204 [Bacteroidetes bacterium]|nr:hypothetical protein [Bacteroidota bacterium]
MKNTKFYNNGHFNDTISSTLLFFLAYLVVLYISIAGTAFISFTSNISIPIDIFHIDFERAVSSTDHIWSSSDNIFIIFSFSPLILFCFGLVSLILNKKSKIQSVSIFAFWCIFHSIIRICGDYIAGHIFSQWGPNLVTDFMGITYPSNIMRVIFIIIFIAIALFLPLITTMLIKGFFNPYNNKLLQGLRNNIIIPAIFGLLLTQIWFIPSFSANEISIAILSILSLSIFCLNIIRIYKPINQVTEIVENDYFNHKFHVTSFVVMLVILIPLKIVLTKGIYIVSSSFSLWQLDAIFITTLLSLLTVFIFIVVMYYTNKNFLTNLRKNNYTKHHPELDFDDKLMEEDLLKGTKWEYQTKMRDIAEDIENNKTQETD